MKITLSIIASVLTLVLGLSFGLSKIKDRYEDAVVKVARETPIQAIGLSIIELNIMKADCEKALPRDQECVALIEFVPTKDRGQYETTNN